MIELRKLTVGDAPALAEAIRRSYSELRPWMPWATADHRPAMAREFIRNPDGLALGIVARSEGVIGVVGVNKIDELNRAGNLGYWVRSDQAGKGIATDAARRLAARATAELGLHRLVISMSVENHPSRRVAEKLEAVHEGIARQALLLHDRYHDAHIYSLITSDLAS